jgi:hypothetical protein
MRLMTAWHMPTHSFPRPKSVAKTIGSEVPGNAENSFLCFGRRCNGPHLEAPRAVSYAIAFATLRTQGQHSSANLAVIQPNGTGFRQLTSGPQPGPAPIFGYEPVAWSASGSQLLAFYGGGQIATAIAVDTIHGGTRLISGAVWPRALSRDGSYVVGETPVATSDGFVARTNVLRVPWAGGNARVLLRKAMTPSFTG